MKPFILFLSIFATIVPAGYAQVPMNSIVEHFTNTKCSICASKNPGFYTNLNATPAMMHLSIHPSAPYATCPLSLQNTVDNDARTNYYGVYGGTPRLVINGTVIASSANYSSASLFTPYLGLTSSFTLQASQTLIGTDSIRSTVIIKKISASTLSGSSLFIGLAEDTVFVNGGNGETKHYHVLRKSPSSSTGITVTLPSALNDSVIVSRTSYLNPLWNPNRIYTVGILQETGNKKLIQSGKSPVLSGTTGVSSQDKDAIIHLFPNPVNDFITVNVSEPGTFSFCIFDLTGKIVRTGRIQNYSVLDVSALSLGMYTLQIFGTNKNGVTTFYITR